jgi:hypothetical protein
LFLKLTLFDSKKNQMILGEHVMGTKLDNNNIYVHVWDAHFRSACNVQVTHVVVGDTWYLEVVSILVAAHTCVQLPVRKATQNVHLKACYRPRQQ